MDAIAMAAICIVIGFLLLLIEAFLIPGFGFAGVLGGVFILGGSGLVWHGAGPAAGVATLLGSGGAALVFAWLFVRSSAARRFILERKIDSEARLRHELVELAGKQGVAVTNLRPSGSAEIDGERYDVVTESEFIEPGTAVRVIEVEGFRIVVEALPETEINDFNPSPAEGTP